MREIKFRALDRTLGKWFVLSLGELADAGSAAWSDVDWSTVGQTTGLKDKNGRDVYEGDIVIWEINEGSDGYPNIVRGLYVVSWCEKEGLWIFRDPHSGETWKMFDTEFDEIIGNVHENPELVEPKGGGR